MRAVIALVLAAACAAAGAQEFKPYADAAVTPAQWQSYFDEVMRLHGASRRDDLQERLVLATDAATGTDYIFTAPGHPAHPAWIARRIVRTGEGLALRQVGFPAGAFEPLAGLFKHYLDLTERMRRDLQKDSMVPGLSG